LNLLVGNICYFYEDYQDYKLLQGDRVKFPTFEKLVW